MTHLGSNLDTVATFRPGEKLLLDLYDAPEEVKRACARHGLTLLSVNTAIGDGPDGHRGLAAVPGREAEFAALADQAIGWAQAAGGTAVHVLAGLVPKAVNLLVNLSHWECGNAVCKGVSFTYGSGFPALWSHENINEETHDDQAKRVLPDTPVLRPRDAGPRPLAGPRGAGG